MAMYEAQYQDNMEKQARPRVGPAPPPGALQPWVYSSGAGRRSALHRVKDPPVRLHWARRHPGAACRRC
jgi:hypothetical protein